MSYQDERSEGGSWVSGLAGRGIGRGNNPFRYDSLSSWQVGTKSVSQSEMADYHVGRPKESDILNRRTVTMGNESLECIDYWPPYAWSPARSEATTIAHVNCSGSGSLHASFDGLRIQLPTFYGMLSGITPAR